MYSRIVSVIALAALLTTSSCSREETKVVAEAGASAPSRTSSCDRITASSVCSEWSGAQLAQNETFYNAGCVKLSGTFVAAECPNTQVLGSCTLSIGEVRKFYAAGGAAYDAARAEKECTGPYKGKWSALK